MYINQYQTNAFEIEIKYQDIFRNFLTTNKPNSPSSKNAKHF